MNRIIHLLIPALLFSFLTLEGQIPMPCLHYNSTNANQLLPLSGTRYSPCLTIDTGGEPFVLADGQERHFRVNEGNIDSDFEYSPQSSDAEFSITLGERNNLEAAWFEPINYFPQLYEKIEWGVKLPSEVEAAIDNWIVNDQNGNNLLQPALNPFDPEQIDVHAIVEYPSNGQWIVQPVFGFFYQEFDRITVYNNPDQLPGMDDPDNWFWKDVPVEYRFRIRWAADVIAHHKVTIKVNVPGFGNWEMIPFEFDSYWANPRNSFVSVSENKHYLRTVDNYVFFPVGMNINEGAFGCNCELDNADDCEECYHWGFSDPCCGISENKRRNRSMPHIDLTEPELKARTLGAAAYVKLERILEYYANEARANAFRTFIDPLYFDVEFEKLNNYYDRQYQAWEMDNMLDQCRDLNLRVQLNLQIHYAVTKHPFGEDQWDWDNTWNCSGCGINNEDEGWCYWRELGLDEPIDFLTNADARNFYKKKLRYIIARWGYSKNIYLMELMSEMNNLGTEDLKIRNEDDTEWIDDPNSNKKPYDMADIPTRIAHRLAIADWHKTMSSYIKNDLHH